MHTLSSDSIRNVLFVYALLFGTYSVTPSSLHLARTLAFCTCISFDWFQWIEWFSICRFEMLHVWKRIVTKKQYCAVPGKVYLHQQPGVFVRSKSIFRVCARCHATHRLLFYPCVNIYTYMLMHAPRMCVVRCAYIFILKHSKCHFIAPPGFESFLS